MVPQQHSERTDEEAPTAPTIRINNSSVPISFHHSDLTNGNLQEPRTRRTQFSNEVLSGELLARLSKSLAEATEIAERLKAQDPGNRAQSKSRLMPQAHQAFTSVSPRSPHFNHAKDAHEEPSIPPSRSPSNWSGAASSNGGVLSPRTSSFLSRASSAHSNDGCAMVPMVAHENMSTGSSNDEQIKMVPPTRLGLPTPELNPIWHATVKEDHRKSLGRMISRNDVLHFMKGSVGKSTQMFHNVKRGDLLQKFIIHPSSRRHLFWCLLTMAAFAYDAIMIPVWVFEPTQYTLGVVLHFATLFIWTVDLVVTCFMGFVDKQGEIVMQPKKILCRNLKTLTGLQLDFVILITDWIYTVLRYVVQQDVQAQHIILNCFRLGRMIKASFRLNQCVEYVQSNTGVTRLLIIRGFLWLLFGLHIAACGWYYVGSKYSAVDGSDSQSHHWIILLDGNGDAMEHRSLHYRYWTSLHWATAQLGFGTTEIVPTNSLERCYAVVTSFACLVAFSWLLASVISGVIHIQNLRRAHQEDNDILREFMHKHRISWRLRNRIWTYLTTTQKSRKTFVSESSVRLLKELPAQVSNELRFEIFIPALSVHPFFGAWAVSKAEKSALFMLVERRAVQEKTLSQEQELFKAGEGATHMYFVLGGMLQYHPENRQKNRDMNSINDYDTAIAKHASMDSTASMHVNSQMQAVDGTKLGPQEWLCEVALWLQWVHVGTATARLVSELVCLEAHTFQHIMKDNLPQAILYAKRFLEYSEQHRRALNDVFKEVDWLRSIAEDVFTPITAFDISHCQPSREEWNLSTRRQWERLWQSSFKEEHVLNRSALLFAMTTDMKHAQLLMYHTLYARNAHNALNTPRLSPEEVHLHDLRVLFLKRFILCIAICGAKFTPQDNGTDLRSWPFPLATVLCHGGRVVVELEDVPWKEFVNLLLQENRTGWNWEEGGVPNPLKTRVAATHGLQLDPRSAWLWEAKLKKSQSLGRGHLYMDIPLGGFGNPMPHTAKNRTGDFYIGPAGVPYNQSSMGGSEPNYQHNIQHGHLYMRYDDFGVVPLPLGLPTDTAMEQLQSAIALAAMQVADRSDTLRDMRSPTRSPKKTHKWNKHVDPYMDVEEDWLVNLQAWKPVDFMFMDDLKTMLAERNCHEAAQDDELLTQLFSLIRGPDATLVLEENLEGKLRAHGIIVHVCIEMNSHGQRKALVHRSATADPSGLTVNDMCVLSVPCKVNESWSSAIVRYCVDALGMDQQGANILVRSCCENPDKACIYEGEALPSFVYGDTVIAGKGIPIAYSAYRFEARVRQSQREALSPLTQHTQRQTREEYVPLDGFAGFRGKVIGNVTREWRWMATTDMEHLSIVGIQPPPSHRRIPVAKKTKRICGGLLGIECCAPLKEDFFGNPHGFDGQSKDVSAFGQMKWRDYRRGGQGNVPADLGGVRVHVNEEGIEKLQQALETLKLIKPSDGFTMYDSHATDEKDLFKLLLQSDDDKCAQIVEEKLGITRPKTTQTHEFSGNLGPTMSTPLVSPGMARSDDLDAASTLDVADEADGSVEYAAHRSLGQRVST